MNSRAGSAAAPKLFVNRRGQPLVFFVRGDSPPAELVRQNITKFGGQVSPSSENAIVLCGLPDPNDEVCYNWGFVDDCIQQGCLMDIEDYKYTAADAPLNQEDRRQQVEEPTITNGEKFAGSLPVEAASLINHAASNVMETGTVLPEQDTEPPVKIRRTEIKAQQPRAPFTKEQDKVIMDYFTKNQGIAYNTIARQLSESSELLKPHPHRSIINRFRKLSGLPGASQEDDQIEELTSTQSPLQRKSEQGQSSQLEVSEGQKKLPTSSQDVHHSETLQVPPTARTEPESGNEPYLASEIASIVNSLSEDYKVHASVVYHALYIFSGNVNQASIYLRHGKHSNLEPWAVDEDKSLFDSNEADIEQITSRRGERAVIDRLKFLAQEPVEDL